MDSENLKLFREMLVFRSFKTNKSSSAPESNKGGTEKSRIRGQNGRGEICYKCSRGFE